MKGREVMAAALVDVDEVRVEAIVGEVEGVEVRPEVSCFSNSIDRQGDGYISSKTI